MSLSKLHLEWTLLEDINKLLGEFWFDIWLDFLAELVELSGMKLTFKRSPHIFQDLMLMSRPNFSLLYSFQNQVLCVFVIILLLKHLIVSKPYPSS